MRFMHVADIHLGYQQYNSKELVEEGFVRTNGAWKRSDALTCEELEQKRQARLLRHFEECLGQPSPGSGSRRCARRRWWPASPRPTARRASGTSSPWGAGWTGGCWNPAPICAILSRSLRPRWKDERKTTETRRTQRVPWGFLRALHICVARTLPLD